MFNKIRNTDEWELRYNEDNGFECVKWYDKNDLGFTGALLDNNSPLMMRIMADGAVYVTTRDVTQFFATCKSFGLRLRKIAPSAVERIKTMDAVLQSVHKFDELL